MYCHDGDDGSGLHAILFEQCSPASPSPLSLARRQRLAFVYGVQCSTTDGEIEARVAGARVVVNS